MGFYDLSKEERAKLIEKMRSDIASDVKNNGYENILKYASDTDTYIRKNTYLILGRLYRDHQGIRPQILNILPKLVENRNEKVRQTVIYTLGEIGKVETDGILGLLESALKDKHPSVRNAVIGALKQMGEKNPEPTIEFARKFLHHPDPSIRRKLIHGIELRGRTHPEDILPVLKELQNDENKRVKETIIHVIGQISYKQGCLEKVVAALKKWDNHDLVGRAIKEILDVHKRYKKFTAKSSEEAKSYIDQNIEI